MRLPLLFVFIVSICAGQIVTSGLKIQYDMVTVSAGALTDLSGNGNNGTLHGTTQTSFGTTFNGSSDYVALPVIAGNGAFTAIACWQKNSGNDGFIWSEAVAGGNNLGMQNNKTVVQGNNTLNFSGSLGADWRCYFSQRSQNLTSWGIIDSGQRTTGDAGASTFTASAAGLGAQVWASGQNTFWLGQLGYFMLYTRALPVSELNQNYTAIRSTLAARTILMKDVSVPTYSGRVWNRIGSLNVAVSDNQVLYTATDCVLVSNPCFQLYGDNGSAVQYSESSNAIEWQSLSNVITNHIQVGVVKVGSTYHAYASNLASTQIDHYTGTVPNVLTLANSAVIVPGANLTFDSQNVFTPGLLYVAPTYYMVYSAKGNAVGESPFVCGGATSPDGATWTKTGQVTGFADPSCNQARLAFLNGKFVAWVNDTATNFYRISSVSFTGLWQGTSPGNGTNSIFSLPTFQATANDENVQMADPCVIEVNGTVYMFYEGHGTNGVLTLKLATAPMPLSVLITTGEGASSDVP